MEHPVPTTESAASVGVAVVPVTVVIPAFNREDLLPRAIASVRAQEGLSPAAIIVVDDASTDGTAQVARDLGARVLVQPENRGAAQARNAGLRAATTPWIALLDSDDCWLPHHLRTVWPLLGDDVAIVGASGISVGAGEPARYVGFGVPELSIASPRVLYPANCFPASGVVVSREAALRAGGFRADLRYSEDLDLWVRLLAVGAGRAVGTVSVLHHRHSGQKSKHDARRTAQLRIATDYADQPWWSESIRAAQVTFQSWDDLRGALRERRARAALKAGRALASDPRHLVALARLLGHRKMSRRIGRLFTEAGDLEALSPERSFRSTLNGRILRRAASPAERHAVAVRP